MLKSLKFVFVVLLIVIFVVNASVYAADKQPEFVICDDLYDYMATNKKYETKDIDAFFERCKQYGVSRVYIRVFCQVALYHSKLNYNAGEVKNILSAPDKRTASGAFALKVGCSPRSGGVRQDISDIPAGTELSFSAKVLSPDAECYAQVINLATGKPVAATNKVTTTGDEFKQISVKFKSPPKIRIIVAAGKSKERKIFILDDVSLKDAAGKEFIYNGDMKDIFMLQPRYWAPYGALFLTLNGDIEKLDRGYVKKKMPWTYKPYTRFRRPRRPNSFVYSLEKYDPLAEAVKAAKKYGITLYAWIDPVDDGARVMPGINRYAWSSRFMEDHPQYRLVSRSGVKRWGQLCFGYKAVKEYKNKIIKEVLAYDVDGIVFKMNGMHNLLWDNQGQKYNYDKYAANTIALKAYNKRWGKPLNGKYDLEKLKIIQGDFFIDWLREASAICRQHHKKLAYMKFPGDRLDKMCGDWFVDTDKIVKEKLIDELLIEPRYTGDYKQLVYDLESCYGYSKLCKANNVKFGIDFTLNYNPSCRTKNPEKDIKALAAQLDKISRYDVDFISVYEAMNIDNFKVWGAFPLARKNFNPANNIEIKPDKNKERNIATISNGARVELINNRLKWEKPGNEAIDGDLLNGKYVYFNGLPTELIVRLPRKYKVDSIKLFHGLVNAYKNPSTECGIRKCEFFYRNNGKWYPLNKKVLTLPSVKEAGKYSANTFFYKYDFAPVTMDAFKMLILESTDTGLRMYSPKKPLSSPLNRGVYIRKIEIFTAK